MNWFKPVLKWLAIVLCIVGFGMYVGSVLFNYPYKDSDSLERVGHGVVLGLACLSLAAISFGLYRFGSKPVLKWLAIIFFILGCGPILIGLSWRYGFADFVKYEVWQSPLIFFVSMCFGLAGICFGFYRFSPQLKPAFKWLGIALGIVVILLALFLFEESIRGRIALRSYVRELHARGEKLTLAEMDLPKLPTNGNGAVALMTLTNQFESLRTNCTFDSGPFLVSRIRLLGQGHGLVRTEQPDLGVNRRQLVPVNDGTTRYGRGWFEPVKADWTDLDTELSKASNVLEQVRNALREPAISLNIDYSQGYNARCTQAGVAAKWLGLAALAQLRHGDTESATQNILDIVWLTHFGHEERLIASQVNRAYCGSIGLNLTWEALQALGITEEQLLALQNACRQASVIQNTASILEMDRLLQSSSWNQFRTNVSCYWQWEGWPYDFSECLSDLGDRLHATAWQLAWVHQDEVQFLKLYEVVLERSGKAVADRNWSALNHLDTDICYSSVYNRMRFTHSPRMIYPIEYPLRRVFEYEAQREMAVAAIAIKRYQLHTGKLPPDLAALVPEYVPQLPHDWMDGQPLRYHVNPNGTSTLYSVGVDGRDDGGDPTPMVGRLASTIWQERDAVWPLPASPEEVAAAQPKW